MTPTPVPCPLCFVMAPAAPLCDWLIYTAPFVESQCRCPDMQHAVIAAHPHTQAGCAGYGWLREVAHESD